MAVLGKQGGRHYLRLMATLARFFEPSVYLPSLGTVPAVTPVSRTLYVGFVNRTIVVGQQ